MRKKALSLALGIILILYIVILSSFTALSSGNPGFGNSTDWSGNCQWTGGCGASANGIEMGVETFYLFWIPMSSVPVQRTCVPDSPPCGPVEKTESLDEKI
ncbi:hypothetical protein KRE40_00180 [Elizabethkingia meningoseptica]|uniref:Uncharacterized protein n=2 Tax=Elizabethkingia meningoseptica TaxID=238 RepID=A0A1V3TZN5_ELIME|nr:MULTISPECIES: hypothetical protein [Elizabethkingia]AQX13283.1 hypothetical protein BBD35_13275 [Elizabethkingia meningoseptica]MBG0514913.1 hypothetical protein [Elizabethkingia meningoseptica]MDE5433749.1 hypothetical protein [Elizabethkingia meningoseptica]MDE5437902.1 hypothetical protein [Elizabethkingia meningoseptica]MDE5448418.1 hypothetical protein [Elizabethkingia meningoseptica]